MTRDSLAVSCWNEVVRSQSVELEPQQGNATIKRGAKQRKSSVTHILRVGVPIAVIDNVPCQLASCRGFCKFPVPFKRATLKQRSAAGEAFSHTGASQLCSSLQQPASPAYQTEGRGVAGQGPGRVQGAMPWSWPSRAGSIEERKGIQERECPFVSERRARLALMRQLFVAGLSTSSGLVDSLT